MISLATFGSLEQKTGSLASGFNFAIPVSIIRSFLDSAKVDTKMSQAALAFNRALSFFYSGYYTKALKRFSGVRKINEEYPQLSYYIEMSSKKMSTGEDRDTIQRKSIFRLVALAFIIGGLLIYFRWKWKANRNKTILN